MVREWVTFNAVIIVQYARIFIWRKMFKWYTKSMTMNWVINYYIFTITQDSWSQGQCHKVVHVDVIWVFDSGIEHTKIWTQYMYVPCVSIEQDVVLLTNIKTNTEKWTDPICSQIIWSRGRKVWSGFRNKAIFPDGNNLIGTPLWLSSKVHPCSQTDLQLFYISVMMISKPCLSIHSSLC